jgi:hypothetical protein
MREKSTYAVIRSISGPSMEFKTVKFEEFSQTTEDTQYCKMFYEKGSENCPELKKIKQDIFNDLLQSSSLL